MKKRCNAVKIWARIVTSDVTVLPAPSQKTRAVSREALELQSRVHAQQKKSHPWFLQTGPNSLAQLVPNTSSFAAIHLICLETI
jgi:hypothetical protein